MPTASAITPSDLLTSASDELGDTLAAVRGEALDASGEDRKLFSANTGNSLRGNNP